MPFKPTSASLSKSSQAPSKELKTSLKAILLNILKVFNKLKLTLPKVKLSSSTMFRSKEPLTSPMSGETNSISTMSLLVKSRLNLTKPQTSLVKSHPGSHPSSPKVDSIPSSDKMPPMSSNPKTDKKSTLPLVMPALDPSL